MSDGGCGEPHFYYEVRRGFLGGLGFWKIWWIFCLRTEIFFRTVDDILRNVFFIIITPYFLLHHCKKPRYSSGSCHLEVQLLGDKHGNVCALSGRDCSSQRRFQKIFEEGPPSVADPDVFHEMQLSAMRLAQQVGYTGAGTVEFLYNRHSKEYYFLELNPRLQVEHPVTECITGVNIPAAQLQIGSGCSLHEIADIRRYFLRGLEDTVNVADVSKPLDFSRKIPVRNHCIAARITAENPEDGFMPNSGTITKVGFICF